MLACLLSGGGAMSGPVDPTPVLRLARMARQMARPVCRGHLPYGQADAALICGTLRAERAGALQIAAGEMIGRLRLILKEWIEREEVRRRIAAHRIQRALKPMIAARRPWHDLIAEAHQANGADLALTEDDVLDVVEAETSAAMPRRGPAGRHRYGR